MLFGARTRSKKEYTVSKFKSLIWLYGIKALYKETGIFPAYHMNHTHWISVTLDDSLTDNRVMQLVDTSFRLTEKKIR